MSVYQKGLKKSKKDIRGLVKLLGSKSFISKVYLKGSRSPLSKKQHRRDSDWDLVIQMNNDKGFVQTNLRKLNYFADLTKINVGGKLPLECVELYPEDKHNILK